MGAKTEYMAEALAYGNIALLSVFISSFTLFFQAVQLGFGQTAIIMKTNILGNIVNVIMNFILIFGMGPIPAMGVAGAAIGTVISTIFSLCWTIYLMKKDHLLEGGSFIPDQAYFKKVTPIFLSVFSEQGFERIGMVLFTRMAASLGTIPFAVHSICMNIADIYWDYIVGFGKASMVTAGQSIGKKSETEWHAFKRAGIKWTLYLFHRRVHPHCRFQRRNLFLLFFRSRSACYERHCYAYLRCREFSCRTCPRLRRYPARQRKDRFCCGVCFRKHHDSPSYHDSILPFCHGLGSCRRMVRTFT